MALNALAVELNDIIAQAHPTCLDLLSDTGKALFFPKGILTQSAEAKQKATRYNATIGIATEEGIPMYLPSVHHYFNDLDPKDIYPYAPSTGKPGLRAAWTKKQFEETPSLAGKTISSPVVTNALTHALTVAGNLCIGADDTILLPNQLWGNYRLTWSVLGDASISTYEFFNDELSGFNVPALKAEIDNHKEGKLVVVLNFPNNPSGYSLTRDEQQQVVSVLTAAAMDDKKLVVICDDAYYGMFFDENCATESIFGPLASAHENLLAIKVDGATKEEFVWGLRVGFITFGIKGGTTEMYQALEKKAGGAVRGSVSNINHAGQSIVLKALESESFRAEQAAKVAILRDRAQKTLQVLDNPDYADLWDMYPFNAGYFMCVRVKGVKAEDVRQHLLNEHGIGVISLGETDIRVAFSCVEESDIADLFDRLAQSVRALQG